jgi:hypothetical protein
MLMLLMAGELSTYEDVWIEIVHQYTDNREEQPRCQVKEDHFQKE